MIETYLFLCVVCSELNIQHFNSKDIQHFNSRDIQHYHSDVNMALQQVEESILDYVMSPRFGRIIRCCGYHVLASFK